ncbi:MAG: phosphatidylserine decarboxylase-domain-containing protein [Benjaminiella poitrasii]|nr:MAG: phosphatidylserine decarboxylase-domain-containing protein [Benjaminiella poitrasii]
MSNSALQFCSVPTDDHSILDRHSSTYTDLPHLKDPLLIKKHNYSQQYANMYFVRLLKLRQTLQNVASEKWDSLPEKPRYVKKILDVRPGELCYMFGTIYLEMPAKPNVMKNLEDEDSIVNAPNAALKYKSEGDMVSLEDESGRVEIKGACLSREFLVTGMVIGILGKEVSTDAFEVIDICLPGMPEQEPILATPSTDSTKYVALLSGLNLGAEEVDMPSQLLAEFLAGELGSQADEIASSQISRVIIAGNSVLNAAKQTPKTPVVKKKYGYDASAFNASPMLQLDELLEDICCSVDVDIMTGPQDPAPIHFPQQPMHPSMFKNAHKLSTFHTVTNPYWCQIDGITFLGTSGQNVDDIYKYLDSVDRLKMAEICMYWRHMAPTAPDTLWAHPFEDRDPFVLETCPHVYFIGNQPQFEDSLIQGPDGQKTRVILVPSFSRTGIVVLVNLKTLECTTVQINRENLRQANDDQVMGESRIKDSWNNTEVKWYPISVTLGLSVIAFIQYRRVIARESEQNQQQSNESKRKYLVTGPWQVHVAAALPLRTISRLWGAFNSLMIPTPLRPFGYKLYSWIFGCNLDEMKNPDLRSYRNLSEFFYRELKEGARPIAEDATLVSPSDGKVLHFGLVHGQEIEQIKGVTYKLDALLGNDVGRPSSSAEDAKLNAAVPHHVDEEEFANVNGIDYSLDDIMIQGSAQKTASSVGPDGLARSEETNAEDECALVRLADVEPDLPSKKIKPGHALFFCVVYLAPGDYHRFHSPTNWVVQTRRHFAGELFSVSPYFVKMLQNLFVLNERVALLGKWRYGFFSMIPVGATNVGSIKINFDEALKTNRKEDLEMGTFTEVTYRRASQLLGGKALRYGEEMGGFYLGSTVVLVFEAPETFRFAVTEGQKIKMGEAIGYTTIK